MFRKALYTFLPILIAGSSLAALNQSEAPSVEQGKFIWADLFTTDPEKAASFYMKLFGWIQETDTESDIQRRILLKNGQQVAGIVTYPDAGAATKNINSRWIGYIAVNDVEKTADASVEEGGRIFVRSRSAEKLGQLAIVTDPEGTYVGLLDNNSESAINNLWSNDDEWTWAQLFSKSPKDVLLFYRRVFGYEIKGDPRTVREDDYLLISGNTPRAGLVAIEAERERGGWLGFVRCADLNTKLKQVDLLGGSLVMAPITTDVSSKIAVIADPLGGIIGLIEYPSYAENK
ncbi:MAG: VOC family protein [Verrucomicrobiota bacterium]